MLFNKEPAVIFKVFEEIIRALIPLALIFGWVHWDDAQKGAVLLFVGVVAGGITLLLTRSQTVPVIVADKQMEIAKAADPSTDNAVIVAKAKEATQ